MPTQTKMTEPLCHPEAIAGLDPGSERSAWVVLSGDMTIEAHGIEPNEELGRATNHPIFNATMLVVERMVSAFVNPKRGGYVGREVFDGQWWGAFLAGRWSALMDNPLGTLHRKEIVTHLTGSARGNDSDVRTAVIERFAKTGQDGKQRPSAIGTKKHPGPLYGLHADEWSALAVALTWMETREIEFSEEVR